MKYEHQRVCAEYNAWGKPEGTAQTHACGDSRVRTMDREQREQGRHEGGEAQLHLATCHRVRSFAIVPHIPCGVGLRGRDVTSTAQRRREARGPRPRAFSSSSRSACIPCKLTCHPQSHCRFTLYPQKANFRVASVSFYIHYRRDFFSFYVRFLCVSCAPCAPVAVPHCPPRWRCPDARTGEPGDRDTPSRPLTRDPARRRVGTSHGRRERSRLV